IRIFQALANLTTLLNPVPAATTLSPARARAGTGPVSLTIIGSGFDAFSIVQWNGVARPTTVVNARTLTTTLSTSDVQAPGTAQVRVVNPAPGGGTSTS